MYTGCYSDSKPDSYKEYKNRTTTKNLEKLKNQLSGIKQNSLKPEDKEKLKAKMIELIQESLIKNDK